MAKEKPGYYAILPATIRYAEDLTELQKLLYAEITALSQANGYCYASNSYFANLYKKTPKWISATIQDMAKKGYIEVKQKKEGGRSREIYLGEIKKLRKSFKIPAQPIPLETDTPIPEKKEGAIPLETDTLSHSTGNIIIQDNNTTSNNTLSSNEESILMDTKQEKKFDLKISSLKILGEEKEKSSAKKEKEVYGNIEINEAMDLVKSYNGGIVNGSDGRQRQFANHLIKKLKKLTSVQEGKFTWQATLEMILKIISENEYHAAKIASPELIYRNLASLMQICKAEFQKIKPQRVVKKL